MDNRFFSAMLIAIAVVVFGLLMKAAIDGFSDRDRVVNVKGLAIKEVKADWCQNVIYLSHKGNDREMMVEEMMDMQDEVVEYLQSKGLDADEILRVKMDIGETSDVYVSGQWVRPFYGHKVEAEIAITTDKVDLMIALREVLVRESMEYNTHNVKMHFNDYPRYEFKSLNDIKPEMIAEATRNAREAAVKFAEDSDSKIGDIKTATQGLFSVYAEDHYMSHIMTVRVVTSVSFFVE